MLEKKLSGKTKLEFERVTSNGMGSYILEYYLIESRLDEEDELQGNIIYGIEIVKRMEGIEDETAYVQNVFCRRDETEKTIEILMSNKVTPISLKEILEDLVSLH